jgi:hypothetical protein
MKVHTIIVLGSIFLLLFGFFFFWWDLVLTEGFELTKQGLYHLSHISSPGISLGFMSINVFVLRNWVC